MEEGLVSLAKVCLGEQKDQPSSCATPAFAHYVHQSTHSLHPVLSRPPRAFSFSHPAMPTLCERNEEEYG